MDELPPGVRALMDVDAIDAPDIQRALSKQKRNLDVQSKNGFGILDTMDEQKRVSLMLDHHMDSQASQDGFVPSDVGTAQAFFEKCTWDNNAYVWLFFPVVRLESGKIGLKQTWRSYGLVDVLVVPSHLVQPGMENAMQEELRIQFARTSMVLKNEGEIPAGHVAVRMHCRHPKLKLVTSPRTGTKMIHLAQKAVSWRDCKRLWNMAEDFRRETAVFPSHKGAPVDLYHAYTFQNAVSELPIIGIVPPTSAMQQYLLHCDKPMHMAMRGIHAINVILDDMRFQILTEDPSTFWNPEEEDEAAEEEEKDMHVDLMKEMDDAMSCETPEKDILASAVPLSEKLQLGKKTRKRRNKAKWK